MTYRASAAGGANTTPQLLPAHAGEIGAHHRRASLNSHRSCCKWPLKSPPFQAITRQPSTNHHTPPHNLQRTGTDVGVGDGLHTGVKSRKKESGT